MVAVTWQWWWSRTVQATLPWQKQVILALSVWLIYLADRWMDSFCQPAQTLETARHNFSHRYRRTVGWLTLGLILTLATITPRWLNAWEFASGMVLLTLASLYFFLTHFRPQSRWMSVFPKEAAVGTLFSLGSAALVPSHGGPAGRALVEGVSGYAVLCFLNCALITRWERTMGDQRNPTSLLNAFPLLVDRLFLACFALAGLSLTWSWCVQSKALLPVAVSAVLLGGLDWRNSRLSLDALRVLSDVVLLTPLLFGLIPW